jgi:hypothetical protein
MPRIQAPEPEPQISDIELFAKAYFGIELTQQEIGIIQALAVGKKIKPGKRMGYGTAERVLQKYVAEGLKPGGRVRLPKHPLPPINKTRLKGLTQEGKILAMIKRPGGAYNFELSRFALKYTSVISDLRKDGYNIVADRQYLKNGKASNTWRYRIGGK